MILQPLKKSSTFEQTFVTKAVTLHVSELLALCNVSATHGYIQPNVNHHFINENRSFQDLDKALKAAVKENTTISTEYDALLTRKVVLESDSVQLQLPTYNAVTEKKSEEGVLIVDQHVMEGFLKILPTVKERVAVFKHKCSFSNDCKDVTEGNIINGNGGDDDEDGKNEVSGLSDVDLVEKTYGGNGEPDAENRNGGETGGADGEAEKGNGGEIGDFDGDENGGETEEVDLEMDGVAYEGKGADIAKAGSDEDDSNSFSQFMEEMNSVCKGLCLSFLDGLHRSYSLVSFAAKGKENFHTLLACSMNVTVNVYVMAPDESLFQIRDKYLVESTSEIEWFKNIFAFKKEDIELILAMTQEKSGTLMLSKKATVGHTVLDAYSVLSRSVRNNSANVYFSNATYGKRIRSKRTYKHVLLDYTSGKNKHIHLDELNSRLFLEKFFKNFFFNHGFEEWAKQGLPMSMKRRILKKDGSFNIESLFKGFYSSHKWEILFTLKGDLRNIRSIIVEKGPCGFGRNNKLFCATSLTVANMLLISLSRLFLLTPTIRETAHNNMTNMQLRDFLTKERLLFVAGIADHISTFALEFYSERFKRTEEMKIPLRCILRTNLENLLLSLYSKEIIDDVLGSDFVCPYELPDVGPFEQSLLFAMWAVHDKLDKSLHHKMMFLDGLAFAYGRYILYFLMVCPFFCKDMLPMISTLLDPTTSKDQKSKDIAQRITTKQNEMDLVHANFEISPTFSLLTEMKQISDSTVDSVSAKDFIKCCLKIDNSGPQCKSEISKSESWNPVYPIPFLLHILKSLHEIGEIGSGNQKKSYDDLIKTLTEYHEKDSVFIKDIKSPQKRKRSSPSTSQSSSRTKKNKTILLYDSSDDEGMDKERMEFEYAFVGVPISEEIENESNLLSNKTKDSQELPDIDDMDIEMANQYQANDNEDEQIMNEQSDNEDGAIMDQEQENDNGIVESENELNETDEPSQNVRRSTRLSKSTEIAEENEDEKVETSMKNSKKKKRNLSKDKEYLFLKAYQTYNYVFPEVSLIDPNDITTKTVTEIACKMYWWNHLQGKSRIEMYENHGEIMESAFNRTDMINDALTESNRQLLDQSLLLIDTTLNNHRTTALGKLFETARFGFIGVETTSSELIEIFEKFGLFPSPFFTDITFPHEYDLDEFHSGENVDKVTFLDPFEDEKKIKVTAALSKESFNKVLLETFGDIEPDLPETRKSKGDTQTEFTVTIKDCASFYEKVLFIGNDVVGCKNMVERGPEDVDLRIELFHEKNTFFLENLNFDHVFRIIDEKAKAYVAPFDRKRNLPLYHDYFTFDPQIEVEDFQQYGTDIVSIVAKILGVSATDINEAEADLVKGHWFYCKNRNSLFTSLFLGDEPFSEISINDSDSEEEDIVDESDDDGESSVEPEEQNTVKPQTLSKRVTRSTTKEKFCRFREEGIFYTFENRGKKHWLKFALLSNTKEPLHYQFDETIYTMNDFKNAHMME